MLYNVDKKPTGLSKAQAKELVKHATTSICLIPKLITSEINLADYLTVQLQHIHEIKIMMKRQTNLL